MEKNVFVDVSGRHVNMKLSFVGGDGEVQMREAASLTSRSAARCPTCVAIFREGMAAIPLLEMVGDRRPATDALLGNRELVFPIPVLHNLLHALEHSFCVLVKFAKVYAAPRQQMEAASKVEVARFCSLVFMLATNSVHLSDDWSFFARGRRSSRGSLARSPPTAGSGARNSSSTRLRRRWRSWHSLRWGSHTPSSSRRSARRYTRNPSATICRPFSMSLRC